MGTITKLELQQQLHARNAELVTLRAENAELRATNESLRAQLGRTGLSRKEELAVAREEAMRTGRVVRA